MSNETHEKTSSKSPVISLRDKHPPHEEGGEGNWLVSYADMMTLLVGFFVILLSFSTIDEEKLDSARKELTKEFGGIYEVPFEEVSNRIKTEMNKMGVGDQVSVKQTSNGIDISFLGTVFFTTGSADLKNEAQQLLAKLIPIIRAENTKFNVLVEGHTDDVPIVGGLFFKNNWELSSIRACRVLNFFAESGFDKTTLTAVGFGETKPVAPNHDPSGAAIPKNQSQNRRVVIKLLKPTQASL